MAEILAQDVEEATEEEDLVAVRKRFHLVPMVAVRKRFHLVPMSETEAIDQMSLLGYEDFFIYFNGDTSEVNVLYRRRDGTLGLIESEIV